MTLGGHTRLVLLRPERQTHDDIYGIIPLTRSIADVGGDRGRVQAPGDHAAADQFAARDPGQHAGRPAADAVPVHRPCRTQPRGHRARRRRLHPHQGDCGTLGVSCMQNVPFSVHACIPTPFDQPAAAGQPPRRPARLSAGLSGAPRPLSDCQPCCSLPALVDAPRRSAEKKRKADPEGVRRGGAEQVIVT